MRISSIPEAWTRGPAHFCDFAGLSGLDESLAATKGVAPPSRSSPLPTAIEVGTCPQKQPPFDGLLGISTSLHVSEMLKHGPGCAVDILFLDVQGNLFMISIGRVVIDQAADGLSASFHE